MRVPIPTLPKQIILIIGLPGCGKTTISQKLAEIFSVQYFSTEKLRAEMMNLESVPEDCDFTPKQQDEVYLHITERVCQAIQKSDMVIVEGVFRSFKQRNLIYKMSETDNNILVKTFLVTCNESVVQQRLIQRKLEGTISPAGINAYQVIKQSFEKPHSRERIEVIDNTGTLLNAVQKIVNTLGTKGVLL